MRVRSVSLEEKDVELFGGKVEQHWISKISYLR